MSGEGRDEGGPATRRQWLLGCAATLVSVRGAAQPGERPARVGVLYPGRAPAEPGSALDRFRQGLREQGLVEERDLQLALRFDELRPELLARQVAELVDAKVDLIVAGHTGSALAAQRATQTIPIVMAVSADPVADGLVASLARPGGNVTGMSIMTPELAQRRLQLLLEAVPGIARVAVALDTVSSRWPVDLQEHERAARALGVTLTAVKSAGPDDFTALFAAARRSDAQAMVFAQSAAFALHRARLAALALEQRMPTMAGSGDAQFARAGGLLNYGANIAASWHRAASHVKRILAGARPAELPVEQPSRFELAVNLKTAAALGIAVPPRVLLLADEVIH